MAVICPVTRNTTPWPAKIFLPESLSIKGAILADQVRSVDRAMRGFRFIERVPDEILNQTRLELAALIGLDLSTLLRQSKRR